MSAGRCARQIGWLEAPGELDKGTVLGPGPLRAIWSHEDDECRSHQTVTPVPDGQLAVVLLWQAQRSLHVPVVFIRLFIPKACYHG